MKKIIPVSHNLRARSPSPPKYVAHVLDPYTYQKIAPTLREIILLAAKQLKLGQHLKIVEVGCSNGPVFQVLSELFPRLTYVGIDKNRHKLPPSDHYKNRTQDYHFKWQKAENFVTDNVDFTIFRHFPQNNPYIFQKNVIRALSNMKVGGVLLFTFFEASEDKPGISPEANVALKALIEIGYKKESLFKGLYRSKSNSTFNYMGTKLNHDDTALMLTKTGQEILTLPPEVKLSATEKTVSIILYLIVLFLFVSLLSHIKSPANK